MSETDKLVFLLAVKAKRKKRRKQWVRPVLHRREQQGAPDNLIAEMRMEDVESYKNFFRMTPAKFAELLNLVEPHLLPRKETFFRKPISPSERLAVTLRYLATGDSMVSMSYLFRLGKSTVTCIIRETCEALWTALSPVFLKPPSSEQWSKISEQFRMLWQFPNCIGALDGKHVAIQAPPHSGSLYYNYKGFFSIVLMASCDALYHFTLVDIGGYGRSSDGGVFSQSKMGKAIVHELLDFPPPAQLSHHGMVVPHVFVADEAFPLKQNLMRPFPGKNLSREQEVFNYHLSRARRCIENAFGIMVARFRIFWKPINASLPTVEAIVKAAVCLHNYLKVHDDSLIPSHRYYCHPGLCDSEDGNGNIIEGTWRSIAADALCELGHVSSNMFSGSAANIRETFVEHFLSGN